MCVLAIFNVSGGAGSVCFNFLCDTGDSKTTVSLHSASAASLLTVNDHDECRTSRAGCSDVMTYF